MKLILILLFLFLTSCASYVKSLHGQIDAEENHLHPQPQHHYDPYSVYRKNDKRPIQNPLTMTNSPTAGTTKDYLPGVRRQYRPEGQVRHKAQDLVDNDNSGSLWTGDGETGFFFSPNKAKQIGDIIVVEVNMELKNQISTELKRAFPPRPIMPGMPGAPAVAGAQPAAPGVAPGAAPANVPPPPGAPGAEEEANGPADKVYDKISTAISEEISRDYMLLRGQKEIFHRGVKRFIEFQGLVSKKDIEDNTAIRSDKLLEPRVYILR